VRAAACDPRLHRLVEGDHRGKRFPQRWHGRSPFGTFRPLWPDRGLADSLLSTNLKECASTRPQQIGAREVYRAVLAARRGKPGTFQTAQLRRRKFWRLAEWPSRRIHRADRSPLPRTLNHQVPHLAPVLFDRGNRLLKAKPP
jgi:hypothetical protein